jgi:catechol 2,3-dioxygenase-like lactoylglutathione lyase family enzyme
MSLVTVRYIVDDVDEAIGFYADALGFDVEMHPAPGFASLRNGDLRLLLNTPGAGGAGTSGDNRERPSPGGWARFQLQVEDVDRTVDRLRAEGVAVRTSPVTGNGGRQAVVEDPSGNPVELLTR